MKILILIHLIIATLLYGKFVYIQYTTPHWHPSMRMWKWDFLYAFIFAYFLLEIFAIALAYDLFKSIVKDIVRRW